MPTIITTSPNIASLDSAILANLCDGIFAVNVTPSIFIGAGAGTSGGVLGASVKITNPYGVVIKNYPTSGYDIYPPMTDSIEVDVPTQANNYQYGSYVVDVRLTDVDGTIYTVTKSVKICAPNPKNKTVNYGTLSAQLNGNCKTGKVAVIADTPPNYQGSESDSQVNDFTLEYPTSSGKAVLETAVSSFSATLYEGVYKFKGTICAHYDLGDYVFAEVNYKLKKEKNIRCLLDKACIAANLTALQSHILSDCTDTEKIATQDKIINALVLIQIIEGDASAGSDASDAIDELEKVLGCVCTCNCADGTPIINNAPVADFVIEGCGFEKTVADLTTIYTINNYAWMVEVAPNGGAITISTPTLADCVQTQTITFNVAAVYAQIKALVNNPTEYNFWSSVVNYSLNGINIACLPVTQIQWNTSTFQQRIQAIISASCAGGTCDAVIAANTTSSSGSDVIVDWQNIQTVFAVEVYMDDVLVGAVIPPTSIFTIKGASDGSAHNYTLISRCSNGSVGAVLSGNFTYYGCADIAPVTVTDNDVTAACPYDLTALVSALPSPIVAEWHTAYDTLPSTNVSTPTIVGAGVYYAFAKNPITGCYSALAQRVVIACTGDTACSAPQNIIVDAIMGGYRVRFQSAAYPPSSYTVKRRLKSDPDVGGSYTTIGTPTYNAGVGKWEILDVTGVDNTLYTYRAISNCMSTAPSIDYDFANLTCPSVTLTPHSNSMGYSFVNVGGGVNKYEVSIYASDLTTLIHTDTVIPAFSNPITGTFIYLTSGQMVGVKVRVFIGTYYHDCAFVTAYTSAPSLTQTSNTNTGPGGTRTQIAQVGASVVAGNKFTATVYSHPVTYTAIFGDTPTTVAAGLRDAINATSSGSWNSASGAPAGGTMGFPPTATASGDSVTIILNFQNQFSFSASVS